MRKVEIILSTGEGHCIEFAAKKEYQSLVTRTLAGDIPPDLEELAKLELILDFLEQADFPALRSSGEGMAGMKNSRCLLTWGPGGEPSVIVID